MDGDPKPPCGCKSKPVEPLSFKPTINQVPFGGRLVQLNSPVSQQFRLQGIGPLVIAWEPSGREAFDVEVRARLLSNTAAVEDIPIVRWWVESSGGGVVWREPHDPPNDAPVLQDDFAVPARGMVWRASTRQFRIAFRMQGTTTGAVIDEGVLQVSIVPTYSAFVDVYPYAETNSFLNGRTHPFPMTAREWRVMDAAGLPFAPAVTTVAFVAPNGGPTGPAVDAALYADWRPIPFDAAAWGAPAGVYTAYR